jgi:hypothetical protein
MMISLTDQQQKAYNRYIRARDRVGIGSYGKKQKSGYIPLSDIVCTVEVVGLNHPLFEQNDAWLEYKEAFNAWLEVEPEFRKQERMSMIRGDYGDSDNWREKQKYAEEI